MFSHIFRFERKNVDLILFFKFCMWCREKIVMYMCTKVEKTNNVRNKHLFIVFSLYLYLQYGHQMCLVDTRTGVASGEAPFFYSGPVLVVFCPELQR